MPRGGWFWLALVLAATSCGGATLSEKSFQVQAQTIRSLAAEGALLAGGVAEGRTTDVFVRVHSEYLRKEARKVEAKLASASAGGTLDQKRVSASRLAGLVSARLQHDAHQAEQLSK